MHSRRVSRNYGYLTRLPSNIPATLLLNSTLPAFLCRADDDDGVCADDICATRCGPSAWCTAAPALQPTSTFTCACQDGFAPTLASLPPNISNPCVGSQCAAVLALSGRSQSHQTARRRHGHAARARAPHHAGRSAGCVRGAPRRVAVHRRPPHPPRSPRRMSTLLFAMHAT